MSPPNVRGCDLGWGKVSAYLFVKKAINKTSLNLARWRSKIRPQIKNSFCAAFFKKRLLQLISLGLLAGMGVVVGELGRGEVKAHQDVEGGGVSIVGQFEFDRLGGGGSGGLVAVELQRDGIAGHRKDVVALAERDEIGQR